MRTASMESEDWESYLTSRVCPMKGVAAYNLEFLMCFSVSQTLN